MGCSQDDNGRIISIETAESRQKEPPPMIHDLVLALVFLAMIITPALLAMRADREEKDTL